MLTANRRPLLIGGAAAIAALAAGAVSLGLRAAEDQPAPQAAAPRLETRVAVSGNIPTARPADFTAPIAAYVTHVHRQLAAMQRDIDRLSTALAQGDRTAARRAWLAADARYESIGAAYGAFGTLDAAINGLPGGLPDGERSPRFTGLHRIERDLWGPGTLRDARASTARLRLDVARLAVSKDLKTIDPLEYALRAHEVLEDALHLQLAGVADRWSDARLNALRANVAGTEVVYGSLRAMVRRRNVAVAREAEAALARLRRELRALARPDGSMPSWSALSQREQERVNGLTAGAAEQLAYVPEIIDPRPPRQPKSAFGQEAQ